MARPPIKRRPVTDDKRPPKPNREALLAAQKIVDAQLSVQDSADNAAAPPPRPGAEAEGNTRAVVASGDGSQAGTMGGADVGYRDLGTPQERHEQRMSWFYSEASRQADNRRLMARDEAMYDNEQWDREDAETLRERGQEPIVYNEIGPTIDWLIGTERRSRVDFYVVAEDDDADTPPGQTPPSEDAINKTKLLKYLDDVNMAPFERSYSAEDSFKAGLGVLEIGLRGDKTGAPIFVGAESWRNFLHDSRAKKDQSDARYNFRVKEIDLDVACAIFPDKEEVLKRAAISGDERASFKSLNGIAGTLSGLDSFGEFADTDDEYDGVSRPIDFFNARERVTIIECWSREPVRRPIGQAGMGDPVTFKIRVSLMVEDETLLETWSPFKHDRFPFVLVWAYRNKRTGMPYGPIRRLVGPQKGLNKRMARGLFEASFNQTELEKGALDNESMDIQALHDEINDPTGILIFANGALSGNKVRQRTNPGAAREQILLAEGDRQALRMMSGVNEENRGLQSQATSRVAMDAKAERGSIQTAELFDNQLLARQQEGEITLSLAEQFVVQPMVIRVAGESGQGNVERIKINQPVPGGYLNDITARRAHFVVGEQAWKQSYAEAAFDSLMQVLTQLASAAPQIVVALLDVVFDMHPNLPKKKAVIERIRAVNGQVDPDGKMTPQQQAAAQQKAQVAQMQFELQMAQLRADVQGAQAKGEKLSTDAIVARVTALYEAAQTAQMLALAPTITPIADQILASAGFTDQSGSPLTIDPSQVPTNALDPKSQTATTNQGRMQSLMGTPGGPAAGMAPPGAGVGAAQGIETTRPDGIRPGVTR